MESARIGRSEANSAAAHPIHAATRAIRSRVLEIGLGEFARWPAAIHARKQESSGALQDAQRRAPHEIGKANVDNVFTPANRQDQAGIGIELDAKARRPAIATEPGENTVKESRTTGD